MFVAPYATPAGEIGSTPCTVVFPSKSTCVMITVEPLNLQTLTDYPHFFESISPILIFLLSIPMYFDHHFFEFSYIIVIFEFLHVYDVSMPFATPPFLVI